NPNDDFFYLEASNDPLRLYPTTTSGATWKGKFFRVGTSIFFIVVVQLGIGTVLAGLARVLLLGESQQELWREHTAGGGKDPWCRWLVGVLVAAGIGTLTAPFSLDDSMGLHIASYPELFLGALTATLVGGVLIATCRRILALVLVALGVDVERTWLDEVLGILAGGLILHHFGADLVAIGLF